MEAQAIVALVIGTVIVLFVPSLVWATVTAGMGEVLRWAGDFFRVVLAMIIMLTPGIVFWLVVVGIIAIIQRWSPTRSVSDRTGQDPGKPEGSRPEGGSSSEHKVA